MRKSNTQLRFWLLTILTMLLLFSLTGCAACGQKNTETNDTEATGTEEVPEGTAHTGRHLHRRLETLCVYNKAGESVHP